MRKIGIQTGDFFGKKTYGDGFALIKRCGFECMDYAGLLNPESELGCLSLDALKAEMREIKLAADNAGIQIYQMHGPWTAPVHNNTPEERRAWCDYAKKCILASEELGSPRYVVHPIMPFGVRGKEEPSVVYETNREFLSEICECASTVGVTVCLENMPFPWMTVYSPKHILDIVNGLESDNLKICLDTGHSLIAEVQPSEAVRELGDKIEAVHVHDNFGDVDRHLMPFQGKIEWDAFALAIRECIPETVPLILETAPSRKMGEDVLEHFLKGYAMIARRLVGAL